MLDTHERQAGGAEESIQLLVRKGESQKALSQFFRGQMLFPSFQQSAGTKENNL
jgi:hypothetical protein